MILIVINVIIYLTTISEILSTKIIGAVFVQITNYVKMKLVNHVLKNYLQVMKKVFIGLLKMN